MYIEIEKEFKKVSAYYTGLKIRIIFFITVVLFVVALVTISHVTVNLGIMKMWVSQIILVILLVAFVLIYDLFERINPNEREKNRWNRYLNIGKRKGYKADKPKLQEIIKRQNIKTAEQLREVVLYYRGKKRISVYGGGNFLAIMALCIAAISFVFDVNDTNVDMRVYLIVVVVSLLLVGYLAYRFTKSQTNIYSNFYQILEELLSEMLIEELAKENETPKKQVRKQKRIKES